MKQFRQEVTVAWTSMIAMEVREIVRFGVYFEGGVNIISRWMGMGYDRKRQVTDYP